MPRVVIAFGSNLGEREAHIRTAIQQLSTRLENVSCSQLYETAPMYVEDQPSFLNGVVSGETDLGPLALLKLLKRVESLVGRTPTVPNGPREIDLDLIVYGVLQFQGVAGADPPAHLFLPHPRLHERRFVLEPLNELDPSMRIPGLGSVADLISATEDQSASVQPLNDGIL